MTAAVAVGVAVPDPVPLNVWLGVCVPVDVEDVVARPVAPGVAPFDTD